MSFHKRLHHFYQKLSEECRLLDYKGKLVSFKCDLTSEPNIEAMFAWIKQHHKGVDVCVNNAGLAIEEPLLGNLYSKSIVCCVIIFPI